MELELRKRNNILIVGFKRKVNLNYANVEAFKSQILSALTPGMSVILDFAKLDFIDSAGLTVLIYLRKKILESNGTLKLANVGEKIIKLMEITRLHRIFEIHDSLESAIRSVRKPKNMQNAGTPISLHFQVKRTEEFVLVRIDRPDSLIAANSSQFRKKLHEYIDRYPAVILNLDAIRNIDSAGIASLIHLKAYAKKRGKKIVLVYKNRVLVRLFKLYSIEDLFPQFDNEEDAILSVAPSYLKRASHRIKKAAPAPPQETQPKPEPVPRKKKAQPPKTGVRSKPVAEPFGAEYEDLLFLTNRMKA